MQVQLPLPHGPDNLMVHCGISAYTKLEPCPNQSWLSAKMSRKATSLCLNHLVQDQDHQNESH